MSDREECAGHHFVIRDEDGGRRRLKAQKPFGGQASGLFPKVAELDVLLLNRDLGGSKGVAKTIQSLSGIGKMFRSGNHGYSFMAQFQEMAGGEGSSLLVVENDGVDILKARLAIEIDQWDGFPEEDSQQVEVSARRAVNNSGNLTFNKQFQSHFFVPDIFIGVTDQDGVSIGSGDILNRFNDCRRERVSDVGYDNADGPR